MDQLFAIIGRYAYTLSDVSFTIYNCKRYFAEMEHTSKGRSSDTVSCNACGKQISRTNLSHHRRSQHPDLAATGSNTQQRSRSSSRETHTSGTSSRRGAGDGCSGPASTWCQCSDAAYALLSQRDAFSEGQLSQFLSAHFPEIPTENRHILIRGAVAGAMYAARLHFSVERNRVSNSRERRLMAIDAGCKLSTLNQGLCSEPVGASELVSPPVITTAEVDALLSIDTPHSGLEMVELANLDMPVSLEACRRDFDIVTESIIAAGITSNDALTGESITDAPRDQLVTSQSSAVQSNTASPYVPLPVTSSATTVVYVPTPIAKVTQNRETVTKPSQVNDKAATPGVLRSSPRKSNVATQRSLGPPLHSTSGSRRHLPFQRDANCRRSPRRRDSPRRKWSPSRRVILSREEMNEFSEFKAYKHGSRR